MKIKWNSRCANMLLNRSWDSIKIIYLFIYYLTKYVLAKTRYKVKIENHEATRPTPRSGTKSITRCGEIIRGSTRKANGTKKKEKQQLEEETHWLDFLNYSAVGQEMSSNCTAAVRQKTEESWGFLGGAAPPEHRQRTAASAPAGGAAKASIEHLQ